MGSIYLRDASTHTCIYAYTDVRYTHSIHIIRPDVRHTTSTAHGPTIELLFLATGTGVDVDVGVGVNIDVKLESKKAGEDMDHDADRGDAACSEAPDFDYACKSGGAGAAMHAAHEHDSDTHAS